MLQLSLKDTHGQPKACIIWLHGLGSSGSNMAGLAEQPPLSQLALQHVFVDAPIRPVTLNGGMRMSAWYDIFSLKEGSKEDKAGILQSHDEIKAIISLQMKKGFTAQQIILAGFSQGGALALYCALHADLPLGGVISLSSYLPIVTECKPSLAKETPIFIGWGKYDQLVLPRWSKQSQQWLVAQGYHQVTEHEYAMEHAICFEEIQDITAWLSRYLIGVDVL